MDSLFGAFDMIGNVEEVTLIDKVYYIVKDGGQILTGMGGSYNSDILGSRITSRHLLYTPKSDDIGFRIVVRLK